MTIAKKEWIDTAVSALDKAYVPYSKFPVGACLVAKNGTIYQGINIENASYGLTNCAERTAFSKPFLKAKKSFNIWLWRVIRQNRSLLAVLAARSWWNFVRQICR